MDQHSKSARTCFQRDGELQPNAGESAPTGPESRSVPLRANEAQSVPERDGNAAPTLITHAERMAAWDRVRDLQRRIDTIHECQNAVAHAPGIGAAENALHEIAMHAHRECVVLLQALRLPVEVRT